MRLVLTGGGTGGHVYPALAIAEAFAAEPSFAPLDVTFVGTRAGLEAAIVPKARLPLEFVHAAPLLRKRPLALLRTLFDNARGFVDALGVLHRARPDVLIATGGYVTFPVVAALRAVRMLRRTRARIALLEPNAAAGLTNRLLAPLVDEIWYALPPAGAASPKAFVTGTPVRDSMSARVPQAEARARLRLPLEGTVVAVIGGSQGARTLNEAAAGLVEAGLPADRHVLILAGARDGAQLRERLSGYANATVLDYLDDPRDAYAASDLVVARAGASTLGELAATGTPALLVPYPHATDDHQRLNAEAFAKGNGARVVPDAELDAARLRSELDAALASDTLAKLRDGAAAQRARRPREAIVARVKAWPVAKAGSP